MRTVLLGIIILLVGLAPVSHAQEPVSEPATYVKGEILRKQVVGEYGDVFEYEVRLKEGEVITFNAVEDYLSIGDKVYLEYLPGSEGYLFTAVDRGPLLLALFAFFVFLIFWFTKTKGIWSLLSLGLSFFLLLSVFVPMLFDGVDPLLLALLLGGGILFLSIFVTHGFTRQSLVSFIGSMSSIGIAVLVVSVITSLGSFSGVTDHSALFLSSFGGANLDFVKIFAASVIIGTLGVLDDITITQVSVVRELAESSTESRAEIFKRALRVGRDHISSLVNTLIFAYVGSALPLIMFMSQIEVPFMILISQEFVAVEIVRSLIGAISLIIAVPITTWSAVYLFFSFIKKDAEVVAHHGHHHH